MPEAAQPDAAPDGPTDSTLMDRVAHGDRAALAEVYDRYAAIVYAVCLRVLRQPADAEAAVSDVFLEIWRKPSGFDGARGSCRTYLVTLARSRSIDRLRSAATRRGKTAEAQESGASATGNDASAPDPSAAVESSEQRSAVRLAVRQLSNEQREVLMRSFFDGLTHKQIAEQLGLPLGTVKTRIRSGLKTLRRVLAEMGVRDAV